MRSVKTPALVATLLLLAAPASAGEDPTPYVPAPADGALWGFDLDHPRPDAQGGLRVAYVMIDGEDPAVGDVRGDVEVDCRRATWRTLASGIYDPRGEPVGAASPVDAPSPLSASANGRLLAAALCDGHPAPGARHTVTALHALHAAQLR